MVDRTVAPGATSMRIWLGALVMTLAVAATQSLAVAGELGHYQPGVANIRDFAVPPEAGFYYEHYNIYYTSDKFKDRNGDTVETVSVGGVPIKVEADLDVFASAPVVLWVTDKKLLGANYAAYISPSFGSTSVSAAASIRNLGLEADDSQFGIGDTYVQPFWLGWHGERYDLSVGYGFYAPTGKYDADEIDNIGLGFWTHQLQAGGYAYFGPQQATALMLTATYEVHSEKSDVDITPGDHFALDYGISQYLSERLEIGVAGYSHWQVEDDSGSDAARADVHPQVHAIGGQISYWPVRMRFNVAARYLHEYGAEGRFEGSLGTLTATVIF